AKVVELGDAVEETNLAVVRTGAPMSTGDPTYQAEILVPQGGTQAVNHSGRPRVMCIRGPTRPSKDQALTDAARLTEAAK
ncbi:unnamed protein product, partial [Symbiodinium necroappetens]